MTANEKLAQAKLILGYSDNTQDALLTAYITNAGYFILSVTGQSTIPTNLEGLQVEIAVNKWGKRGAEGEVSHSEGGVSITYESLSDEAKQLLRSQTLARVVNMLEAPEEA
jgi:hypothetical protein